MNSQWRSWHITCMSSDMTKPTKWLLQANTQIRLGRCWAESSLCAQWVAKDPSFLHADSEDFDQTGRMPRLIWVFAGRTLILLVLSCHGSHVKTKGFYENVCWFDTYTIWSIIKKMESLKTSNGPRHSKTCLMPYANNKGADQPAHPRSLISTFVVRCLDSVMPNFKTLASRCSWADRLESYLVENFRRHIFVWCGSNLIVSAVFKIT